MRRIITLAVGALLLASALPAAAPAAAKHPRPRGGKVVARAASIYGETTTNYPCTTFRLGNYWYAKCVSRTYYPVTHSGITTSTYYYWNGARWVFASRWVCLDSGTCTQTA